MNVGSFKVHGHIASKFSSTYLLILLMLLLLFYYIFVNKVQILYTLNLSDIRPKVPSRSCLEVHVKVTYNM
jgi:hypothetical protein